MVVEQRPRLPFDGLRNREAATERVETRRDGGQR
jgi:hypothetical protein